MGTNPVPAVVGWIRARDEGADNMVTDDAPRDTARRDGPAPPSPAILLQMMTGYWVSQAIYVAAKLGLADLVAAGPVSCTDLAAASGSHAPTLYRVLRALASVGIFTEPLPDTSHSPRWPRCCARRHPIPCALSPSRTTRSSTAPGASRSIACGRATPPSPPLRTTHLRLLGPTRGGRSRLQRGDDRLDHPGRRRSGRRV